ncbi:HNH endonuclease [Streptomyces carpaticus]|uniref:HNH endonuclease n=1 Tax=Streptomyces carpaticus TaxID=285558 RepID=UPI0022041EDD|nr:HNH endonuclease [Streptomyces carpaticus]
MPILTTLRHTWLTDPAVLARFEAKRYRPSPTACWHWLGAISSTGHGSFRAGTLPGPTRRGTVPAHLFAYHLHHGPPTTTDLVLCHQCDEAGCVNPTHLRPGTKAENRTEWATRRHNPHSPLADTRGPAARSRAISRAIRAACAAGEPADAIDLLIRTVQAEGRPLALW